MNLSGETIVGEPIDTMRPTAVAVLLWYLFAQAVVGCFGTGALAQEATYPTLHVVIVDLSSRANIDGLVSYIVARPSKFHGAATGTVKIRVIGMVGDEVYYDKILNDQSQRSEEQVRRELQAATKDLVGSTPPLSVNAVAGRVRENVLQLERQLDIDRDLTRGMKPTLIVHLIARDLAFRTKVKGTYNDIRLDRNEAPDACFKQLGPDQLIPPPDGARKPLIVFDFVAPGELDVPTHTMRSVIYAMFGDAVARMTVLAYRDRLTCIGSGEPLSLQPLDSKSGNCGDAGPPGDAGPASLCVSPSSPEGVNAMVRRQHTLNEAQGARTQAQLPPGPKTQEPSVQAPTTRATPAPEPQVPAEPKRPQPPGPSQNLPPPATQSAGIQPTEPQLPVQPQRPRAKELQPKAASPNAPNAQQPEAPELTLAVRPESQQQSGILVPVPGSRPEGSQPQEVRPIAIATRRKTANGRRSQSSLALTAEPTLTLGAMPENIRPRIVLLPQSAVEAGASWPFPVGIDQRQPPRWAARSVIATQMPEGATCDGAGMIGFTFELQGGLVQEEYATYDVVVAGACDGHAGNIPIASFTMRN